MAACGGGGGDGATNPPTSAPPPPAPPPPAPSPPAPSPPPPPAVGTTLTTLQVRSGATAGTLLPYSATVLPLAGQVPAGFELESPDDADLRGTVLAAHADGSAAVVVVAGRVSTSANTTTTLRLQAGTPATVVTLTVAAVSTLVGSVRVDFGGSYGSASLTDLSAPERVWWANSQTICARYRLPAPTPGSTALEAVIDIHAWAGRALVEVVVENAKVAVGALNVATAKPAAASYAGATVSINGGGPIVTVSSSGMPVEAVHSPFRAWYAKGWVGGDTGLRVTQGHTDLQKHPLLFKCDQGATFDMAAYAADTYTPWSSGRQRPTGMGSGGDHPSIGPLPQWESRALQSGDFRAWNATEVSTLAVLGYGVNYRDSATGLPPTFTQLKVNNVSQNGYSAGNAKYWPGTAYNGTLGWEVAHQPAAGLMAFIARPSPVFIELAQKIAVENGTYSVTTGGPVTTTGVFANNYQVRGRAWCMRALAHAIFLTPDGHPWKEPAKTSMSDNVTWMDGYRTDGRAGLNLMWDASPANVSGSYAMGSPAHGVAAWQHHYLVTELHKAASTNLLTGSAQTALNTLADWVALQPVKWINEQSTTGAWRHIPYATAIGRTVNNIEPGQTYATQMDWWFDDTPPASVSGTWMGTSSASIKTYSSFVAESGVPGNYYPMYFWSALVAAVERNLPGAADAWTQVQNNLTNLSTWRSGFAIEPRWASVPRNR